jgi:antitoxin (DNA-binding transcriptional repressor) of toxin-antitoxin stability system
LGGTPSPTIAGVAFAVAVAGGMVGESVGVIVADRPVARAVGLEAVNASRNPAALPLPIYRLAARLTTSNTALTASNTTRTRRFA